MPRPTWHDEPSASPRSSRGDADHGGPRRRASPGKIPAESCLMLRRALGSRARCWSTCQSLARSSARRRGRGHRLRHRRCSSLASEARGSHSIRGRAAWARSSTRARALRQVGRARASVMSDLPELAAEDLRRARSRGSATWFWRPTCAALTNALLTPLRHLPRVRTRQQLALTP